jgi:hypothetical protein
MLRLLLVIIYTAPLAVPVTGSILHALEHAAEAHANLLSGLPGATPARYSPPHAHPHAGDHRHGDGSGHGVAVEVLLTAADALEHDTDAGASVLPLRLAAHLPGVLREWVVSPRLHEQARTDIAAMAAGPSASPPSPPPRSLFGNSRQPAA